MWPRSPELFGDSNVSYSLLTLPPTSRSLIKNHLRRLRSPLSRASKEETTSLGFIHSMVRNLNASRSGETGFASGLSAIAILTALRTDSRALHVAIDPFQPAYRKDGLRGVAEVARVKVRMFQVIV